MDIYISDIKNDANHPRATGTGELGSAIKNLFPKEYRERENLEQLLILMLNRIKVLEDRIDTLSEVNNLIEEPL